MTLQGRYEKDEDGNIVFNDGDLLIPAQNGGLRTYDTKTGKESDVIGGNPKEYTSDASIRPEIKNSATTDITVDPDAKFIQLPSTKAAVNRYLNCVGKSLGIMPPTKGTQSGFDTVAQFGDGRIAMIVERGYEIGRLREFTKANSIEWGVAPLPQYKEYKNPSSNDTTVKAQGVEGGHSEATALCITKTSKNFDNAWKVIDWLTSDTMTVKGTTENAGQYFKAACRLHPQHAYSSLTALPSSKTTKKLSTSISSSICSNTKKQATGGICPITHGSILGQTRSTVRFVTTK